MPDRTTKLSDLFTSPFFLVGYSLVAGLLFFILLLNLTSHQSIPTTHSFITSGTEIGKIIIEQSAKIEITLSPSEQPSHTDTFLNLQPIVDIWNSQFNAEIGLMIYDLDHQKIAASYHPNQIFNVASIYKLFFAYAGYQQTEQNYTNGDAFFVKTFDYRAGDYTFYECLDLMLRESYNGCADPMRERVTNQRYVKNLISKLDLNNTSELGLYSTAHDLTKLLILYWKHPDLSTETWLKIADSLLNQPPTDVGNGTVYDWRQGLPAGFSSTTIVYDKVGWSWNGHSWDTYADAAIVEFPRQNRHYTIVVLTSGLSDPEATPITNLAQMLEAYISNPT